MFHSSLPVKLVTFFKKIKRRKLILFAVDTITLAGVLFLMMLMLKLAGRDPFPRFEAYALNFAVFWALIMSARSIAKIYRNIWRYADSQLYLNMIFTDFVAGAFGAMVMRLFGGWYYIGMWEMIFLVTVFDILCLCSRFLYQCFYRYLKMQMRSVETQQIVVAIVGAGQVGSMLAKDLLLQPTSHYKPVFFVDNDPAKIRSRVVGLPVYDNNEKILDIFKAYSVQEIFITMSTLKENAAKVIDFYTRSGCKIKFFGLPAEETDGGRKIRELKIEDLLCRDAKNVVTREAKDFYRDRVVLVTGGGGSIGSELCLQIAKNKPKQLIIFDIYENNVYEIQQELIRKYGDRLNLAVEIGSVRDRARLEAVFSHYRPELVFHAAAHKHVPLMEHSNAEAIKNNVFGTYNTADMAEKYGAEKFILISTDKAVNPTNIMGASKRICEMVIQCRNDSKTVFSAVRFGNVLGSNGSVIPLFKKQIEEGGPVTITDKRIIRYFMTISEASRLVIQAGAMAKSGELFVLDMGNPVKILELAENMIRLSGLVPYQDIDIKEIGLRPGEKLYEELLIKTEDLDKTENDLIFVERDHPLTREAVEEKLALLEQAVNDAKNEIASQAVELAMKKVVPTYRSPEEVNCSAEKAEEMHLVK